jgi:hypothetical protein
VVHMHLVHKHNCVGDFVRKLEQRSYVYIAVLAAQMRGDAVDSYVEHWAIARGWPIVCVVLSVPHSLCKLQ